MPDIHFECPKCTQSLDAPEYLASELIECPTCKETIEVPDRSRPTKTLVPAPRVMTAEQLYFANNQRWRACPVCVYQGIVEVADGRRIATRAISSKEIIAQQYSTNATHIRNLTTTAKALRFAGWALVSLGLLGLLGSFAFAIDSGRGGESDSAHAAAGIAFLAAITGLILILSQPRTSKVMRWGTLYHLTITYPGCDQYIQTASSLMAFFGSSMGFGIIGTSGKLTSGDIIFSSTDREAVARLSEDIEKDLRRGPRE